MMLSYDGIVFDIILLKDWKREAVYTEDKSTFLFWHHVIQATTLLSDGATNSVKFPRLVPSAALVAGREIKKATGGLARLKFSTDKLPWRGTIPQRRSDLDFLPQDERSLAEALVNPLSPLNLIDSPDGAAGTGVGSPGQLFASTAATAGRNAVRPPLAKPGRRTTTDRTGRRVVTLLSPATPAGVVNTDSFSHSVPTTDNELRTRLARPRRELVVWLYTGRDGAIEYILRQPHLNAGVDAMTGPICTVLGSTAIHGQMTEVMDLQFETWEAPSIEYETIPGEQSSVSASAVSRGVGLPRAGRLKNTLKRPDRVRIKTPAVLSHRWKMSFGWDAETQLRTQIIEGEVIFRSDVLNLRGLSADQLRPYFMAHKIPVGYVRAAGETDVQLDDAGHGVRYKIVDKQQMTNFPGGVTWGVISLEADTEFMRNGWDGSVLQ